MAKRTSLDNILPPLPEKPGKSAVTGSPPTKKEPDGERAKVKKAGLLLTPPVHRQLRLLAFEEDLHMHDLYLEAIDMLFAERGLPSISELESEANE